MLKEIFFASTRERERERETVKTFQTRAKITTL